MLVGLSRYDLILLAIPALFCQALLAHVVFGLSLVSALLPAATLGLFLVVDAVYRNPPTDPGVGRR